MASRWRRLRLVPNELIMRNFAKDFSTSAFVAGFIATVISYAGPLVIIFQVAQAANLPFEQLTSWIWTISIGSGFLGIYLSLRYKVPVIIAWNAPGSALLVSMLPQISLAEAIGAYIVSSLIILAIGLSGTFDKLVNKLPATLAAGMLAGILFGFGAGVFTSIENNLPLVLLMFAVYIVFKRLLPRYAVMAVLFVGMGAAYLWGDLQTGSLSLQLAKPVFTAPEFSLTVIFNVALPLVVVALTGQFVPGMAVLRNDGYPTASSPLLTSTGLGSLLLAPFGCHGLSLAAITAAICTSSEAHSDPKRRYVAGVIGGVFYLLLGMFGASIVALFMAFPQELIATLAGLALLGAIANSLHSSMSIASEREAALITFLVTASNMSMFGLASAFWGLMFGLLTYWVLNWRQKRN